MRIRSVLKHSAQALAEGALISILVVGLIAGSAFAGRGGAGLASGTQATLIPDCNPCDVGTVVHFTGSGYDGSQGAAQLYTGGGWAGIPVNADGTVAFAWNLSAVATYDFKVYQNGKGKHKLVLMAEALVVSQ
jgi:hypothetical protein